MKNMFKKYSFAAMALALVLAIAVQVYANESQPSAPQSVDISTMEAFNAAVAGTVPEINITASFTTAEELVVSRPVSIKGNGNTISFSGNTSDAWNGIYVLQIYNATDVTIEDIGLSGGDVGLLVNGSTVTLGGTINVSGNEFGGIESSQGSGVGAPVLTVTDATIVNSTEAYQLPTAWEDGTTGVAIVGFDGTSSTTVKAGQVQYYLDVGNTFKTASVANYTELTTAIADSAIERILISADFTVDSTVVVSRPVIIDGAGHTVSLLSGNTAGWNTGSHYVFQVYNTTGVTIKDIALSGADAALLVNASSVVLNGTIDVSGNEFGGIESSKGTAEGLSNPSLNVSGASLLNSTESYGKPTVWEDKVTGTISGFVATSSTTVKSNQTQYYLTANNAKKTESVSTLDGLKSALLDVNIGTVVITAPIDTAETILVDRSVTINAGGNTIKALEGITGSVVLVRASNVNINELVIDGASNYVHGLNIFSATGVNLTSVTAKNNDKSGIVVNGSKVVANNITTSENGWNGINVDRGQGVITEAKLTVTGSSAHTETTAIWVDDKTKSDVSVVAEKYTSSDVAYTKNSVEVIGKKYSLIPEITEENSALVINASTPEVNITVDEDVLNPTLDFTTLVNGSNEATTPVAITVATETEDGLVTVSIPTGTKITGTGAWTELTLPKVSNTVVTPELTSRQTANIGRVIEIGSPSMNFTFDKPVRLVFAGEAGQKVGFMKVGGTFTEITTECGLGEVLPAGVQECKMDTINDLVVLTKHFTTFATYEVETRRSSGGGGGRVAVVTTPVVTTPVTPTTPVGQVLGETTFNFTVAMKAGSSNKTSVMELQKFLNAGNFGVLAVDGAFGPKTKAAVMAFQRANLLVADGIVGPKTLAALNK